MKYKLFDIVKNTFINERISFKNIKRGDWLVVPRLKTNPEQTILKKSDYKDLYLVKQKLTKNILLVQEMNYNGIKEEVQRVIDNSKKTKGDK